MRTLLLLAISLVPASAGKRIVINVLNEGVEQHMETLVDATRLRVNMGAMGSVIFLADGPGPRFLIIEPGGAQYLQFDKATLADLSLQLQRIMDQAMEKLPPTMRDQLMQQMKNQFSTGVLLLPRFEEIGPRTVKGIPCTAFAIFMGDTKHQESCLASPSALNMSPADAAVLSTIRSFSEDLVMTLQSFPIPLPAEAFSSTLNSLPGANGFGIQMINFEDGRPIREDVFEKIEDATFTDADFSTGTAARRELLPAQLR
jgi:hypothetical protein